MLYTVALSLYIIFLQYPEERVTLDNLKAVMEHIRLSQQRSGKQPVLFFCKGFDFNVYHNHIVYIVAHRYLVIFTCIVCEEHMYCIVCKAGR